MFEYNHIYKILQQKQNKNKQNKMNSDEEEYDRGICTKVCTFISTFATRFIYEILNVLTAATMLVLSLQVNDLFRFAVNESHLSRWTTIFISLLAVIILSATTEYYKIHKEEYSSNMGKIYDKIKSSIHSKPVDDTQW